MAITLNGSTGITTDIDGDESLTLNRDTSDGDIITLQKDNSTVGSIGTNSSRTYVGSGSGQSGIKFNTNAIVPVAGADGVNSDNTFNLGVSSARFKDLYLSGGVYVGGTGSANYLDDYEEGTFTPTYGGTSSNPTVGTYYQQRGYYRKIGSLVYVSIFIQTSSCTGGSGSLTIQNLPFTADAGFNSGMGNVILHFLNAPTGTINIASNITSSDNRLEFVISTDNSSVSGFPTNAPSSDGSFIYLDCTYYSS